MRLVAVIVLVFGLPLLLVMLNHEAVSYLVARLKQTLSSR